MSREYKVEREYSIAQIIRYNLRMWWLAAILAVLCALALGGYKYKSLHQYVENEVYENRQQVAASLFVGLYSDADPSERVNNIRKIASSNRAYQNFKEITGYDLTVQEYQNLFDTEHGENSDVASFYVTFPASYGDYSIMDEEAATAFMNGLIATTEKTCEEMIGQSCVTILDAPYTTSEIAKLKTYTITESDFRKAVLKAVTAGILLGIIVEIVCYSFWMLIYTKPKDAEEIRECLDTDIIDCFKEGEDNEESFKKVAMFLKDDNTACNRISCMTLQCPKKDSALKLAMSYANEQKKTLYIDLSVGEGSGEDAHSISKYVLGQADHVEPLAMNAYLDSVTRNKEAEKGLDIAGNKRFAEYVEEMGKWYEYIVINSADASKAAEAYAVSKLCNKTFVVCGRRTVRNEVLYRAKNTADVNGIHIDGALVYEL